MNCFERLIDCLIINFYSQNINSTNYTLYQLYVVNVLATAAAFIGMIYVPASLL